MKTRTIKINIRSEPEPYEALLSATMNHTQYDSCYIMQYSEYRGSDGQMVAEFMLRDAEPLSS